MMGLIGQGCEHGDVLEVTGTNTPTQKTHIYCVGDKKIDCAGSMCLPQKKRNDYCVCVCCTVFDTTRCPYPVGVWGWLFQRFVLVVLASRVRPVPFRSR